jgi:hypothetical protein
LPEVQARRLFPDYIEWIPVSSRWLEKITRAVEIASREALADAPLGKGPILLDSRIGGSGLGVATPTGK